MWFDPNSLALILTQPYAADTCGSITEALDRPNKAWESFPEVLRRMLNGHRDASGLNELDRRLNHELDHLRRHLSTPYGLLRHVASSMLVRLTANRASAPPDAGRPPGFFAAKDGAFCRSLTATPFHTRPRGERERILGDPLEASRLMHVALVELVRGLDGLPARADPHLIRLAAGGMMGAFRQLASGAGPGDIRFDTLLERTEEIGSWFPDSFTELEGGYGYCPLVQMHHCGGRTLLEHLGFVCESTHFVAAHLSSVADPSQIDVSQVDVMMRGMVRQTMGHYIGQEEYGRIASEVVGRLGPDFAPNGLKQVALYLIAELALWIPITPDGVLTTHRQLTWVDMHPAFRLTYLCEALERYNLFRKAKQIDSVGEADEWATVLQEGLCYMIGWPSVREIADRWLRFLETRLSDDTAPSPLWIDGGRTALAITALHQRVKFPITSALRMWTVAPPLPQYPLAGLVFNDRRVPLPDSAWGGTTGETTNWHNHLLVNGSRFLAEGFEECPWFSEADAVAAADLIAQSATSAGDAVRSNLLSQTARPEVRAYWALRARR